MKRGRAGAPLALMFCLLFLPGCATSLGYRVSPPKMVGGGVIHYLEKAPPVAQNAYQCGPAALESVMRYWGHDVTADSITRVLYKPGTRGILNFALAQYAKEAGFWTQIVDTDSEGLKWWLEKNIPPVVMLDTGVLWLSNYHFVVLKGFNDTDKVFYANVGKPETYAIHYMEFQRRWESASRWCLIICPPERVDWELGGNEATELGLIFERSKRPELAEKWYRRALNKNLRNLRLRFNLANVYLGTRRLADAKAIYGELLKEKPAWSLPSNNLAWIYLQEGRPREAANIIETAFKNGAERRFDILDTLGLAYHRLDDDRRARTYFLEALSKASKEDARASEFISNHLRDCAAP